MFSKKITINLEKKDDIFHLEPLGDIHIGHVGFNQDLYKKRIRAITKDDNRYTLFMGDQLDAINIFDKRFNPDTSIEHEIDNQKEKWKTLTKPLLDEHMARCREKTIIDPTWDKLNKKIIEEDRVIMDLMDGENPKIWGLLHGNHEYKIREITRAYLENNFCYPFGIPFLGAKCYIGLEAKYKDKVMATWEIMAMHGSGGGKPEHMLHQMKQNNYMDVFLCGHLHQKLYKPEEAMQFDFQSGKVFRRNTHLANTGTFCYFLTEGTSGYGDQKNEVVSTPIGTCTLSFNAERQHITGHI